MDLQISISPDLIGGGASPLVDLQTPDLQIFLVSEPVPWWTPISSDLQTPDFQISRSTDLQIVLVAEPIPSWISRSFRSPDIIPDPRSPDPQAHISGSPDPGSPDLRISISLDFLIPRPRDLHISRSPYLQISRLEDLQISRPRISGLRIYKSPDLQISGVAGPGPWWISRSHPPQFSISPDPISPDLQIFRSPHLQISRPPDLKICHGYVDGMCMIRMRYAEGVHRVCHGCAYEMPRICLGYA